MTHKTYFKEPSAAQINGYDSIVTITDNFIDSILDLKENEAVVIERNLVPKDFDGPGKFMKHGTEVKIRRTKSLEKLLQTRQTPVQLRESAFNGVKNRPYCGYSIKPFIGTDKRTKKISLVECLQGTKIYCYATRNTGKQPSITVKPYDAVSGVKRDGADIIVHVPSRTKKIGRYEIRFNSVPVYDSEQKYGISYNISTDHSCKSKRFNIRYTHESRKETSKQFNFCAHEVAAYLSIIDHYWNKDKNIIPLQMSQIAIPTQYTVDFYRRLSSNCLIKASGTNKPRKLNRAEKEILLWGLVHKAGHDKNFFATDKIKDYLWE